MAQPLASSRTAVKAYSIQHRRHTFKESRSVVTGGFGGGGRGFKRRGSPSGGNDDLGGSRSSSGDDSRVDLNAITPETLACIVIIQVSLLLVALGASTYAGLCVLSHALVESLAHTMAELAALVADIWTTAVVAVNVAVNSVTLTVAAGVLAIAHWFSKDD